MTFTKLLNLIRFTEVTFAFLLLFEFLGRLFLGIPPRKIQTTSPDPLLNHKWIANLKYLDQTSPAPYTLYTNKQSWVEEYDISANKPRDTFRIFYVGDSNVQGVVEPKKKMVEIVERALNDTFSQKGLNFEVINTGTTSYAPILYYLLIKNDLLPYSPDLVVINVDMTDIRDDSLYRKLATFDNFGRVVSVKASPEVEKEEFIVTPEGKTKIPLIKRIRVNVHAYLIENSALFYHLGNRIYLSLKTRLVDQVPRLENNEPLLETAAKVSLFWIENQKETEFSMNQLCQSIELIKERGIKVLVTGVPHYPNYAQPKTIRPHEILSQTAKKCGSPYLNSYLALKEELTGIKEYEYYWWNDPTHFNELGNYVWAEAQLDFLLDPKNELLPF